jgi:hypothetical protein
MEEKRLLSEGLGEGRSDGPLCMVEAEVFINITTTFTISTIRTITRSIIQSPFVFITLYISISVSLLSLLYISLSLSKVLKHVLLREQ